MLEILQDFESAVGGPGTLKPIVLIAPGLAAIVVGLLIWLGGSSLKRPIVALVGAIVGGICGYFLVSRNIIYAAVSAAVTALIAIVLQRVLIAILIAGLVAVIAFAVLIGPHVEQADEAVPTNAHTTSEQAVTIRQSIETVKACAAGIGNTIKRACRQMPLYNWAIILVLAVVFIAAGFWLWRLASALCCSALGTMLIFAGMILLLMYKGSAPITKIRDRASFFAAVFVGMTAFGTIEQLILCRRAEARAARKKEATKSEEKPQRTKQSWRNR